MDVTKMYDPDNYKLKDEYREDAYVFDIETDGFLQEGTRIHCLVAINIHTKEVHRFSPHEIGQGIEFLSKAKLLIAHNGINFDVPFIHKFFDVKLPYVTDTLLLSRLVYSNMRDLDFRKRDSQKKLIRQGKLTEEEMFPGNMIGRHSLESWGHRLGEHKGDFGKQTDWKEYTPDMLEYCEQDCWVTLKLFDHFQSIEVSSEAMHLEHAFASIIQRQVEYGWAFDEKKAVALYGVLAERRGVIKDEMTEMFPGWWTDMKTPKNYVWNNISRPTKTELKKAVKKAHPDLTVKTIEEGIEAGELKQRHTPFNPGSRQHIYKVFYEKYGWKPTEYTPSGEPKIDETVLKSLKFPEAILLSEYFMLDKRIGQIAEGNQAWLKTVTKGRIHGSVNTLGAVTGRCTHSHPNLAQVPAGTAEFGLECRELFTHSTGMVNVGADASGLELRCLAHYMAFWDNGDYVKVLLEGDVHAVNQQAAGLPTRDNAKTFIYALLYGAGDGKIGSIIGQGLKAGRAMRQRFLKTLPALGSLVDMVKNAAKKGHIKGLDGRKLHVRSEHSALNTLLQSAGAIVMKMGLVMADRLIQDAGFVPGRDYEFIGNIHDEMQAECLPEHAETIGKLLVEGIVLAGLYFNFNCPLDGDYKIGDSWRATH